MKKQKILRKENWNDVNITYVSSTGKGPSELSLRKRAEFNQILDKMPKEQREKLLNGEF